MKFETMMLRSLFAASVLVCCLILGSMLGGRRPAVQLAAGSQAGVLLAPVACTLPADGVLCLPQQS